MRANPAVLGLSNGRLRRFSMKACRLFARVLSFFPLIVLCVAQPVPAPRDFSLTASDGTVLTGTYFAASKPGPGVMLLHQCNQQRKSWDGVATRLTARGMNVLTLDYRGFGESGGGGGAPPNTGGKCKGGAGGGPGVPLGLL